LKYKTTINNLIIYGQKFTFYSLIPSKNRGNKKTDMEFGFLALRNQYQSLKKYIFVFELFENQ